MAVWFSGSMLVSNEVTLCQARTVSTRMSDHLQASSYNNLPPGQLSLAIPLWVPAKRWGINGHTMQCT